MKKYMLLLLLCCCGGLYADLRLAIVDVDLALKNSPQVNSMQQALKKKYTPKQNKILAQRKQLTQEVNALRRDESVLKASDLAEKKQKIQALAKNLQQMESKYQQEIFAEKSQKLEKLQQAFQAAVRSVANKQSIDMVVNKPSIIYSQHVRDISQDVASALKKAA